ncbi:uncharacterized protein LOC134542316 [Bacillus rossius redtenbacheri]|uniref:uncharacterized protein LOC134542316 n=1 Tax=Bacillus rossius redtenbacheri TaxID=93214 RepID=UPI002FDD0F2A
MKLRDEDRLTADLDVRWPAARLSLSPGLVHTYPEQPVVASLEFPPQSCPYAAGGLVPELWLDLVHCGSSRDGCRLRNHSLSQVLYSEQVRGYPRRRQVSLKCELFGLAGHYALLLRSAVPSSVPRDGCARQAVWSDKFIFNVHARSIFPCDALGGGVPVLFEYPRCILEQGDRVRLFARLRADVASLAPPTSLRYVAERAFRRGAHSLRFDCDLFSERYVEYCFVYVNRAVTGAVNDVRMDCVPTLPVADSDSGGWGEWSGWTQCSTSCGGGTRNRYRLCDSPPPRYGAKFCEGAALQTERCGAADRRPLEPGALSSSDWECLYPPLQAQLPAERPEVRAEVGPLCRCGCVVHLGTFKPRRLLASSSHSCPGRTFWLVQANPGYVVRLSVDHFRLPCASQWLKVRDGDSLSARLAAQLAGGRASARSVTSSGPSLLLEFFTDELLAGGAECGGGFLAHAQQLAVAQGNTSSTSSPPPLVSQAPVGGLRAVHVASVVFVAAVMAVSACLAAQYVFRYRKYQRAAAADDCDSAPGSLALSRSRAASSATLLSEVISLRRFRGRPQHARLREEEEEAAGEARGETDSAADSEPEYEVIHADRKEEREAVGSDKSPEDGSGSTVSASDSFAHARPELPRIHKQATIRKLKSDGGGQKADGAPAPPGRDPPSDAESTRSCVSALSRRPGARRPSSRASVTTLANGCYSPVLSLRSNPKECKDKRNLEKLLAGSEFSLAGHDTDFELDYYDYNVSNAGDVPGSYLGMDPAYLVWIPPFAPGFWDERDDVVPPSADRDHQLSQLELRELPAAGEKYSLGLVHDVAAEQRERGGHDLEMEQLLPPGGALVNPDDCGGNSGTIKRNRSGARVDVVLDSPARVHYRFQPGEKETQVEKSPSGLADYYGIIGDDGDIKFADDEDDDSGLDRKSDDDNVAETNKINNMKV